MTLTVPVPPSDRKLWLVGVIEYAQPAWLTVNVSYPIVIVPLRGGPALGATENPTVPFPDPLEPDVTVIQAASLTAVQEQPDAETPTLLDPPLAGKL